MQEKLRINSYFDDTIIDTPQKPSGYFVVFIPGLFANALTDAYTKLSQAFLDHDYSFLRYQSWRNDTELREKNFQLMNHELGKLFDFVRSRRLKKVGIVAKSFGGAITLSYMCPEIYGQQNRVEPLDTIVMWAPTIGVSDNPTIGGYLNHPFSYFIEDETNERIRNIKTTKDSIFGVTAPVRIIHGTNDDIIDIENSRALASFLCNAEVMPIEGADHSYAWKNEQYDREFDHFTVDFFKKHMPAE